MRKWHILFLSLTLAGTMSVTAAGQDIFGIQSVLGTPQPTATSAISVVAGEVLEFSAEDLERRLGLEPGELGGITITSLPLHNQGGLYLDGIEVDVWDFMDRQALDRLCFVPGDRASAAEIVFLPQSRDPVSTQLTVQVLATPNQPPTVLDTALQTVQNMPRSGSVDAWDPEGSPVSIRVVARPQKGEVQFDGLTFTYQPYRDMTGSDSFTICAVDAASAWSREAVVKVQIDKSGFSFAYADLGGSPSAYAVLKLQEAGVLTGEKIGGAWYFHPDRMTTRGDFVLMLLSAAGLERTVQPTVNTGLPNDSELPAWLKPHLRTAIDAGIISGEHAFHYSEIPTRAEAVVLTDRAAAIHDVKDYDLSLPDLSEIPAWALPSYKDLAAYRMLDLHTGQAAPMKALTNSYSADLLWQLYLHTHRSA